jgi:hypothetical protein
MAPAGQEPPSEALPLAPAEVLTLLGSEYRQARWLAITPVALRSRNHLYRLELADAPQARLILKLVRRQEDQFWQHHLRREHWLLELLQRFWPEGAPRPFAAVSSQGWGLLIMEDVGTLSLAEAFGTPSPDPLTDAARHDDRVSLLLPALERLATLHAILRAQHRVFYRICQSIELDRINAATLLDRLKVAQRRFGRGEAGSGTGSSLPPAVLQRYRESVIRPLLAPPRQMIHNSLSPLNVVLGATPRFVDWETMAYAAPEFDLADLLRFPTANLSWRVVDQLVDTYFGATIQAERLRLSALARAIDYAGATARQAASSREAGDTARALLLHGSSEWYLDEARTLSADLGLADVLGSVTG